MTNREIEDAYVALTKLQENAELRFSAGVAYAIVRNMKILKPIVEDIVLTRIKILQKYGDPIDDQPGYYIPKEGQEETLEKALKELEQIDNDINIYQIGMSALNSVDLSIADMEALYFMVDG